MFRFFDRLEDRIRRFLSHYPIVYAFLAGTGMVLFWRGIWHSVDTWHLLLEQYATENTLSLTAVPWWDGPLSLLVGIALLLLTGAFVSSFIGNEIIISGLRGEKKLSERTEDIVRTEAGALADIQEQLADISERLDEITRSRKS